MDLELGSGLIFWRKRVDADGTPEEFRYNVHQGDELYLEVTDPDGLGDPTEGAVLADRYLYGPAVDQVLAVEDSISDEVLWGLGDHQGTVRDVVDSSGNLAEHRQYDSFGNLTDPAAPAVDFLFAFTGRPLDEDTGLYDYRARWYDPGVGRFVTEDPLGLDAGDANLYRYAGNSPVINVDPSGLCFGGFVDYSSRGEWALTDRQRGVSADALAYLDRQIRLGEVRQKVAEGGFLDLGLDEMRLLMDSAPKPTVADRFPAPRPQNYANRGQWFKAVERTLNRVPQGERIAWLDQSRAYSQGSRYWDRRHWEAEVAVREVERAIQRALEERAFAAELARSRREWAGRQGITASDVAWTGAEIGGSFIPLVGEGMDLAVLFGSGYAWWERGLAGVSLGISVFTAGTTPNAGAWIRGGKRLVTGAIDVGADVGTIGLRSSDELFGGLARSGAGARFRGEPFAFGSGARSQRVNSIVGEAAGASGIDDIYSVVDDVVYDPAGSYFTVIGGRRVLSIGDSAFGRTRSGQLLEAGHEIVHAQQFDRFARRGGYGSIDEAADSFFSVSDRVYARQERVAEHLSRLRMTEHLGGMSPQQWGAGTRYIDSWRTR